MKRAVFFKNYYERSELEFLTLLNLLQNKRKNLKDFYLTGCKFS